MDVITLDEFQCVLENLQNLQDLHISIVMPVLTGDAFVIQLQSRHVVCLVFVVVTQVLGALPIATSI